MVATGLGVGGGGRIVWFVAGSVVVSGSLGAGRRAPLAFGAGWSLSSGHVAGRAFGGGWAGLG